MGSVASACVLLLALVIGAPAAAQVKTFCSEPVTPFCVNRAGVFEDDIVLARCEQEVERYEEAMREYVDCLAMQAQEAQDRSRQIVQRFACMAEGEEDCP